MKTLEMHSHFIGRNKKLCECVCVCDTIFRTYEASSRLGGD